MTVGERRAVLFMIKGSILRTYKELLEVGDYMDENLHCEYDRARSKEYGLVCHMLGILEGKLKETERLILETEMRKNQ